MDISQIAKSTQEQATASWINYLNQLRLNELLAHLSEEDFNLEQALSELERAKVEIGKLLTSNRGGQRGMHGFIAEVTEVAVENARNLIKGAKPECVWVNDNGPADLLRGDVQIQQKFVQAKMSLDAAKEHLTKYPDFIKNGGKYQIPRDFYEKVQSILEISEDAGQRLTRNSVPSKSEWEWVRAYFQDNGIKFNDFEPAQLDYSAVQIGKIGETLKQEEEKLKESNQNRRDAAYQDSKPTFREGVHAATVSAAFEGGVAFCIGVAKKLKSGKKLEAFTEEDWREVGIDTAKGTAQGGIRGGAIYAMTNFTATPAAVATALVTAGFGVAALANQLRSGEISEEEFIINSEVICLDVSVSAVSALIGQTVIPIPFLGAIIGNVVGMFLWQLTKDNLNEKELRLVEKYRSDMDKLNAALDERYQKLLEELRHELAKFSSMLEVAFSVDVNIAFIGSIALAEHVGVLKDRILSSKEDIDNYFMN